MARLVKADRKVISAEITAQYDGAERLLIFELRSGSEGKMKSHLVLHMAAQ